MTLLIVDDSPLIVTKIKELLDNVAGITSIQSCGTYAEAIVWLAVQQPKVLLLDINLPDKNGILLLKHVIHNFPATRVIMVTNQADAYYKEMCLQLGASFYLDKSNDFDKLAGIVSGLY